MYDLRHRPTDPTSLESAILGRSAPTDRPAPSARRGPATPGTARPTDPLRHTLTLRTPSERADRPTHLWLVAPEVARLALLELFAFGSGRRIQAHQVLAMRLVCLRGCHHRRAVACVELVLHHCWCCKFDCSNRLVGFKYPPDPTDRPRPHNPSESDPPETTI